MKMPSKVAVISISGNIGKSMISDELLIPRMEKPKRFTVETQNAVAASHVLAEETLRISGKRTEEIFDEVMISDRVVVDIGASNVDDFTRIMQQLQGSHEEIEFFIVPTTNDPKVMEDAVKTILKLQTIGVDKKQILMLFNKVNIDDIKEKSIDDIFAPIFGFHELNKGFVLNEKAVIYENPAFTIARTCKKSVGEILLDDTDYRSKLSEEKKAGNLEGVEFCLDMVKAKRYGRTAQENLDAVFKTLFK